MDQPLRDQIDDLRDSLLSLAPTGERGFEGLIGVTLGAITGITFRLACSGSQFGVDGRPTYNADSICFEGKRYDGDIDRSDVLSKVAELSIRDTGEIDLWVLAATTS